MAKEGIYIFYDSTISMQKPKKLSEGDTIGIIAPSAGLYFQHRLDNAIKFLESQNYKVKEFSCTRKVNLWESGTAIERARDIMDAFKDSEVKAIIALTGGTVATQTLKYLDFDEIKKNPKIFCGYSDNTILHHAFNTQADLVTFYGPCAATQFGEYPKPLDYTLDYFNKAVASTEPIGKVNPSKEWTGEFLDWSKKLDLTRPRKLEKNKGFEWIKQGKAEGRILGGCIESIAHLAGTKYWQDYDGSILFLEISEGQNFEEGDPLPYVDWYLSQLEMLGVFEKIKGMVFGRPYYSQEDLGLLKQKLVERTSGYSFPILFGVDIGHTDPQITVPIGVKAALDSGDNKFEFLESGVSE